MKTFLRTFHWRIADFLQSSSKTPIHVIPSRNGNLYEVRQSLLGRFVKQVEEVKELDVIQEGFQMSLPKMPLVFLKTAISFFRSYCGELRQHEVMLMVYWDRELEQYELSCPYQVVSKTHIEAEFEPKYMFSDRYIPVLHLHSHNTMPAYFSSTDDANEQGFLMLYGVIGELDQAEPAMQFRVGSRGNYFQVPVKYLFEETNVKRTEAYPMDWMMNVMFE